MKIPSFIYGTAWKEDKTERLTLQALEAGFTAVDTANQRKHYYEEGAGRAVQSFLKKTGRKREDLFLQTKFTSSGGQDHRKPYDDKASFKNQVRQSFESSLQHLGTDYLDSYILHGPFSGRGLTSADFEVWAEMEALQKEGKTLAIGVSNFQVEQLEELCERASVQPSFVQNRCFAALGWDYEMREACRQRGIAYQGFSLLTANRQELIDPAIVALGQKYSRTIAQLVFRFSQQVGMIPLTGSSSLEHLKQDLQCDEFDLTADELKQIETIAL